MYLNQPNKSLTGEVRLSYVHLAAPYTNPLQPNAEAKYGVTLLIPKNDKTTYDDLMNSINAAINAAVNGKAWNGVRPPIVPIPVHDGDGVKQDGTSYGPECKGHWVLTASRRAQDGRPWVCDISNPNVELAPQDSYSGMYARCTVHFFGYNTAGKKGIGCSLDGVMKTRDGESLGGAVKPTANEFAQFAQAAAMQPAQIAAAQPAQVAQVQINPLTGLPM